MSEAAIVEDYDKSVSAKTPDRAIITATGGKLIPWAKGQSGNPGGRSRVFFEVQNAARELSLSALNKLGELIESPDERVAIIAANSVLDRAFGKPKEQKTEDNQSPRPDLSSLAPHELAALRIAMAALAREASKAQDVVPPAHSASEQGQAKLD